MIAKEFANTGASDGHIMDLKEPFVKLFCLVPEVSHATPLRTVLLLHWIEQPVLQ